MRFSVSGTTDVAAELLFVCVLHTYKVPPPHAKAPRYAYIGSAPVSGSTYGTCTSNAQEQLPSIGLKFPHKHGALSG